MDRRLILVPAALLLVGAAACGKDSGTKTGNQGRGADSAGAATPEAGAAQQPGSQPFANARAAKVTVLGDKLDPGNLDIEAGAPVQLAVTNNSGSDCSFYVGELAKGINVANGQTATVSFTTQASQNNSAQTLKMGCTGDDKRSGQVVAQFKGVVPAPGAAGPGTGTGGGSGSNTGTGGGSTSSTSGTSGTSGSPGGTTSGGTTGTTGSSTNTNTGLNGPTRSSPTATTTP